MELASEKESGEFGMFQAYGAALRSASPGRQVGAAIARDGDVVALGTNEVPKAFGGQYWDGDNFDARDHRRDGDSTKRMTHEIFADLLGRLLHKGWLRQEMSRPIHELVEHAVRDGLLEKLPAGPSDSPSLAERASLLGILEFMRAVHAEMAALMSAARRGTTVDGAELFSTAFPCHECARHVVAAGIRKVHFIEPYPKSRVAEMYDDSIAIDQEAPNKVVVRAFTGIAPRLYTTVFEMPTRRGAGGAFLDWDAIKNDAVPRRRELALSPREGQFLLILAELLRANSIEI
jgi:deoxycytidylate deaminase